MNLLAKLGAGFAFAALSSCGGPEERPFNEQFNTTAADLENKAVLLDREAENFVDARTIELEEQARALRQPADENAAVPTANQQPVAD